MKTPPEQPVRQSVWQFSLRGLFLATLAVAILSAFAAPLLRAAEPKQRLAFVLIVAETALGAFLCAALLIRRRARLEKRFGTLLLSLAQRPFRRRWIGTALAISQFVMPIWLAVSSVHLVLQSKEPSLIVWLNPAPLMTGAWLSYTFFIFWWRGPFGPIEFCERGVLIGQWGISWTEIKEYRVFPDGRIRLRQRFGTHDFRLPSNRLAEVDALLGQFVPRSAASVAPAILDELKTA